MKAVGGFFELELPKIDNTYHPGAIALSTGRACLRLMLQNLEIKKCYVPFYTCDAVYDPFLIEEVEIETYGITDQFEPVFLPDLKENEYFLYINYFGIKSKTVSELLEKYQEYLIIDNTHLFFHKGYKNNWSFTSARKYFGVPDGAYLYSPKNFNASNIERFKGISLNHNVSRLVGLQAEAHKQFSEYEKSLTSDVNAISVVSERLLALVNYEDVKEARRKNFWYLHMYLSDLNRINIDGNMQDIAFSYPFLPNGIFNKSLFYKENFFIPSLWIDPANRKEDGFEQDKEIAVKLLPLPIDHRYNKDDLRGIIDLIKTNMFS